MVIYNKFQTSKQPYKSYIKSQNSNLIIKPSLWLHQVPRSKSTVNMAIRVSIEELTTKWSQKVNLNSTSSLNLDLVWDSSPRLQFTKGMDMIIHSKLNYSHSSLVLQLASLDLHLSIEIAILTPSPTLIHLKKKENIYIFMLIWQH